MKQLFFPTIIIIIVIVKPLSAQVERNVLFDKALLLVDSLYRNNMLYWNNNGEKYFFCEDGDTPLYYDMYSCSCKGSHNSIFGNMTVVEAVESSNIQYKPTRLDKRDLGYKSATIFIFCDKELNEGNRTYIECRVINTKFFMKTIRIRIYNEGSNILYYSINDYYEK